MAEEDRTELDEMDDVVDGEVIAEYGDATFVNLPRVLDDDEDEEMFDEPAPDPARRGFLTRLLIGGAAAAALGGSAALYYDQRRRDAEPEFVVLPNGADVTAEGQARLLERIAEMEAALDAMTADRDRLANELDSTNTDLVVVRGELDDALAQLEEHRRLNALWEQLDAIGLDNLLNDALARAGTAFVRVMQVIVLLRTGIAAAQNVLNGFVAVFPGPQEGIRWLGRQTLALASSLDWLGQQIEEAIEPSDSLTSMVADFVLWVLERLPFGVGNRAKAGLEAMQTLINDLPDLLAGLNDDVLDPLADWFGGDEGSNLLGTLVTPVVENAIEPAETVLDAVGEFETIYKDNLVDPVQGALTQRAALRSEIESAQVELSAHI
jgi:hypothetical protein